MTDLAEAFKRVFGRPLDSGPRSMSPDIEPDPVDPDPADADEAADRYFNG